MDDHQKRVEKYEQVFWDHGDDDDINTRLDKLILDMEIISKEVIEKDTGLIRFFNYKFWSNS